MKINLKMKNGITLVALVVTIVILLILAGISISALTQTGLFGKVKDAKQKSENAQELENTILADYENKIVQTVSSRDNKDSGTSTLISKVEIEIKNVTMNSILIKINLLENEKIYAGIYFAMINGKVITGGENNEIEINNLEKGKSYTIQGGILDIDAKTKISKPINQATEAKKYIYNNGNQYIEETGGWVSESEGNVSIDLKNYNYMTAMATSDSSCMSYIMTKNTLNISNYSKLCAEVYTIGGHYEKGGMYPATFGISTTKGYYLKSNNRWTKFTGLIYDDTIKNYEVDISQNTGNFYIGFSQYLNSKIYKVWFE